MSGTGDVDRGYIFLEALSKIRQACYENAVAIRGNKNNDKLKTKIRSEYWENMELNPVCIDPDAQEEPQTEVATFGDYNAQTNPNYFHLEIKRQDMLNRWNQSSIKERATML